MTATNYPTLTGPQLAAFIRAGSTKRNLDPDAVLAIDTAAEGGLYGAVGDNGTSFGPNQLHAGGALPAAIWAKGAAYAKQWAQSAPGLNYALDGLAKVAAGLKGNSAIAAIIAGFERPKDYGDLVAQGVPPLTAATQTGDYRRATSYLGNATPGETVPATTQPAGAGETATTQPVSIVGDAAKGAIESLVPGVGVLSILGGLNPFQGITDVAGLVKKVLGDPEATLGHALLYLVLLILGVALVFEGVLRVTGSSARPSTAIVGAANSFKWAAPAAAVAAA